ncbi:MAG TPA: peptidoglycan-binding domain-containing protein [Candidatus Saccharimonadales bacterium]|nr:peptidoglycan-binding domain-containing protein [Candidatus Saccharimonadales bacterium]
MRRYLFLVLALLVASGIAALGVRYVGAAGQAQGTASQPSAGARAKAGPSRALVKRAQQVLISAGRLKSKATGVMNPATRSALRAYQKQHGLKGTGTLSAETLVAMGLAADTTALKR